MTLTKILIADDEPAVLEILSRKVFSAGFTVVTAANGKIAWEKIQSEKPDIVLLDLVMPEMDGFAVLKKLRANPPQGKWIPVVVISTMDEIKHLQDTDMQADHYLAKPCRIEDVIKAVKLMISLVPLRNS